jgi:hypothetical protein
MYFIYYLSHALQKSQRLHALRIIMGAKRVCCARNGSHCTKAAERPPQFSIVLGCIRLLYAA